MLPSSDERLFAPAAGDRAAAHRLAVHAARVLNLGPGVDVAVYHLRAQTASPRYIVTASGMNRRSITAMTVRLTGFLMEHGIHEFNMTGKSELGFRLIDLGQVAVYLLDPALHDYYGRKSMHPDWTRILWKKDANGPGKMSWLEVIASKCRGPSGCPHLGQSSDGFTDCGFAECRFEAAM